MCRVDETLAMDLICHGQYLSKIDFRCVKLLSREVDRGIFLQICMVECSSRVKINSDYQIRTGFYLAENNSNDRGSSVELVSEAESRYCCLV